MAERLARLAEIARQRTPADDPAHDVAHVERVVASVRRIAAAEGAQLPIAEAAAWLHELFNYPKGHPDSPRSGEVCAGLAAEVLAAEGWPAAEIAEVAYAIRVHPFSLGIQPDTLEARILQDADRLDALGAIGLMRCFATSAKMARPFYAPRDPFCTARAPDDKAFGLDHLYTKLFRLSERLHTATARALAEERVAFLHAFVTQLARELG